MSIVSVGEGVVAVVNDSLHDKGMFSKYIVTLCLGSLMLYVSLQGDGKLLIEMLVVEQPIFQVKVDVMADKLGLAAANEPMGVAVMV